MVAITDDAGKQCQKEYDLVIVGASLGGLALAFALRDAGLSACVIDTQVAFDEHALTWGHDLQPNALRALEVMGLVEEVKQAGAVHHHWYNDRVGGETLARWDYAMLPHSHPYAVCVRAHVVRNLLRERAARLDGLDIFIPAEFRGYRREGDYQHVTIKTGAGEQVVRTRLLVGADGPRSRVRDAVGIRASFRKYRHGWIDIIMARRDDDVTEGHVVFGRGEYLGIVPTRAGELVTFHLTAARSLDEYKAIYGGDIEELQRQHARMAPILGDCIRNVREWKQMTWTPAIKGRAERWVADGVALVGDAVISVNPITSAGACLALEGGVRLATVVKRCFQRGDFSAAALAPYEAWSRPEAESIQEIGDWTAWAFTTRNPVIHLLKERMLRRLDTDDKMKLRIMASSTGMHWLTQAKLDWRDGLAAAGLWPQRGQAAPRPATRSPSV
jgi:2-polyprenyl-6-methoxyphenol hydroxylase-like FAD-dependent oxidoreductase